MALLAPRRQDRLARTLAIPLHHYTYRAAGPVGRETVFDAGNTLGTYARYREALEHDPILSARSRSATV